MSQFLAALAGLAVAVSQVLWAGARPIYSFPGFAIVGLAGLLSVVLVGKRRVSPDRFTTATACAFAAYIVGRGLTSPVEYLARADILSVLACLIVYSLFATYLTEPRVRLWFLGIVIVLIIPNLAIGLYQFTRDGSFTLFGLPRPEQYRSRASGFFICPNHMSGFLEIAGMFVLAIVFWSRFGPMTKMVCGYVALMAVAGVVLSGSRGGYISFVGGAAVFALTTMVLIRVLAPHYMMRAWIGLAVACVGAVAAVGFVVSRSDLLKERSNNVFNTSDVRPHYWQAAWRQFQDAPLVGTGSGTYLIFGRKYRHPVIQGDAVYTHNDYLQLLAEYGIVGAVLGLTMLVTHFVRCIRSIVVIVRDRVLASTAMFSHALAIQVGALCATVAIGIHSFFDFNLHLPANALLMAAVLGMIANNGTPSNNQDKKRTQRGLVLRGLAPAISVVILATVGIHAEKELYRERARIELRYGSPQLALRFAQRALKLEPTHAETAFVYGGALRSIAVTHPSERMKRFYRDAAVAAYRQGVLGNPYDSVLLVFLGSALDRLRRFDEASVALSRALAMDPNLYLVHETIGLHKHLQGELDAAEASYRRATQLRATEVSESGLRELESDRAKAEKESSPAEGAAAGG